MRYLNGLLCVLLILFVAVQYNDPDSAMWMAIYAAAAAWAGLAAFRPAALQGRGALAGLTVCVVAAGVATAYWWPQTPGWWRQEVWWVDEPAREGMGMMIVTLALLVVAATAWRGRRRQAPAG